MHPDDISRLFPTVLKAAKLPKVRFHDLRHSCATLLLSLGVHAKLVQETLGHSSYQLTMDTYSHMIPALRNEAANRNGRNFLNYCQRSCQNLWRGHQLRQKALHYPGAGRGGRTPTTLRSADFEFPENTVCL